MRSRGGQPAHEPTLARDAHVVPRSQLKDADKREVLFVEMCARTLKNMLRHCLRRVMAMMGSRPSEHDIRAFVVAFLDGMVSEGLRGTHMHAYMHAYVHVYHACTPGHMHPSMHPPSA